MKMDYFDTRNSLIHRSSAWLFKRVMHVDVCRWL